MKIRKNSIETSVSALMIVVQREKERVKTCGAWLMLFILCAAVFCQNVRAEDPADVTLHYIVADCTFTAYQVAEIAENGTYELAEQYASLSVDWVSFDEKDWYELAQTLDTLTVSENLESAQSSVTDENGDAVFSGLPAGLYLIRSQRVEKDGRIYEASPIIIEVDGTEQEIEITKYTSESPPATVEVAVKKIWTGDDKDARPSQITVELFCDGEVYDSAVLSAENNWSASWSELDGTHSWMVAEETVPDGYTVSYEQEDYFFVIVNTWEEETETGEENIEETGETGTGEAEKETEETASRLPQTGAYWPPVFLLAGAGIVCIVIGRIRSRHEEKQGNEIS